MYTQRSLKKNQNNLSLSQIERTWICSQTAYFFHSAFEQNIPPLVVYYDKLGVIKRLSCITVILLSLKFWILAVQLYFIHMYVQNVTTFVAWSIWTIFLKYLTLQLPIWVTCNNRYIYLQVYWCTAVIWLKYCRYGVNLYPINLQV